MFVVTDGRTNVGIKPKIPAKKLRAAPLNAKIFALGVGAKVNAKELLEIAKTMRRIFKAKNYIALKSIAKYLWICEYKGYVSLLFAV